jgi:hypothetical protein
LYCQLWTFKLQNFLLAQLQGGIYEGDEVNYNDHDRSSLVIRQNTLYRHSKLRVNFTTYDLRRSFEVVDTVLKRDIMLLANEDPSQVEGPCPLYWYARIHGIYHVLVKDRRSSNDFQRKDFLWVRWFGHVKQSQGIQNRLEQVEYIAESEGAFGFIDPEWIVRSVHLIPSFKDGMSEQYLPCTSLASDSPQFGDWDSYCVNQ